MSRFSSDLLAKALQFVGQQPTPPPAQHPADEALELAVTLCKRFEGFRPDPYLCPGGKPTIGYGSTYYADGRIVRLTDAPISREGAERLLRWELLRTFVPAVRRSCPVPLTPGRLAALADFAYNLGAGNLASSTLRKRVNAGDWDDVPAQLRRWVYASGKRLNGLAARREAEIKLL